MPDHVIGRSLMISKVILRNSFFGMLIKFEKPDVPTYIPSIFKYLGISALNFNINLYLN